MLQENKTVCDQLTEHRVALQEKEQECDEQTIKIGLQQKEIEALKLQVSDLMDYKNRYDELAKVQLKTKDQEIEDLHKELDKMATEHSDLVRQLNDEKELLIS